MARAWLTIPWTELVRRTLRESIDDDCLGLAAQLSYYLCLALFPGLLFVLALASFFSLDLLTDEVAGALGSLLSPEILRLIQDQMQRLSQQNDGGLLTLGVLGAVWGSSSALVAIVTAINRAYDLPETRPWWRVRLTAIALTLGLALLVIAALSAILAGPQVARSLGVPLDSPLWEWGWNVLRWTAGFALVACGIAVIYHYAPDADQDWIWVTPGALLATALWLVSSLAFKFYVAPLHRLRGDLRSGRRHHPAPALALHLGARHPGGGRAELRNRARSRPRTDPDDRHGLGPPRDWPSRGTAVRAARRQGPTPPTALAVG